MNGKSVRAGAENKRLIKNILIMSAVMIAAVLGILLFLYNIVNFNIVFCIIAFIGVFIGIATLIIKYNTIFTKYISVDDENICIKNWENGFFSYDILNEAEIVREFIPARTETVKVPVKEIRRVLVGTMAYLKKNNIGKRIENNYNEVYAKAGEGEKAILEKTDIMYISTQRGASCFIPVSGMNKEKVIEILILLDKSGSIEIKSSDSEIYKRLAAENAEKHKTRRMAIVPENLAAADIIKSISKNKKN